MIKTGTTGKKYDQNMLANLTNKQRNALFTSVNIIVFYQNDVPILFKKRVEIVYLFCWNKNSGGFHKYELISRNVVVQKEKMKMMALKR